MPTIKTLFLNLCFLFCIVVAVSQKKGNITNKTTILDEKTSVENAGKFIDAVKERLIGNIDIAEIHLRYLVIAEPTNDAIHFEYAQVLMAKNQIQEAIIELKAAIKLNKDNIWYQIFLGSIYNMTRNFSEAEKIWKIVVKKAPNNIDYLYYYTFTLINQNKLKEAIKIYDKIEVQTGVNEDVTNAKHNIWVHLKKTKNAGKELDKLVKTYPNEIRYYLQIADFYNINGMNKNAIPYIKKAQELEPDNPEINIILYNHYLANKQYNDAFITLRNVFGTSSLSLEEKVKIIMNYYPFVIVNSQQRKEAFILLDTLIKAHPNSPIAWSVYGDFSIAIKDYHKALTSYEKVLTYDQSKYVVWEQYLSLLIELNQWEKVYDKSQQAMDLFPNQAFPYFTHALVAIQLEKWDIAIADLEKSENFIIDNDDLLLQIYFYLAEVYQKIANHKQSDKYFDKILSISPNNVVALNNYAYFLSLRDEQLDYALSMAEKATKLEPNVDIYEDTFAWIYFKKGDLEKAEYWIKKALHNNNETDSEILEHYGDILYKKGEHAKALEYWKKSKEKGNTSPLLFQKIEKMQH